MGELFQPTHLLLIAIVAIIFFGPKKLPELGKGLGEAIRGFRDSMSPSANPPSPDKDTKPAPKE
ncbi:MAG TPA: twin-arginine translocase TatA/TatE family subunit [Thermoanaerobaculia bacterium]|jgi:sec-independent protein translocase protein TatA|nr:twin-arginine translocase TatA/TatE family subunit [Thermoanaerobaculia bacterium]